MQEIKTIADIEKLKNHISSVRSKCKRQPNLTYSKDEEGFRAYYPTVHEKECIAHNEQFYSDLPKEIPVSSEIGAVVLNVFLDELRARRDMEDKFKPGRSALGVFARIAGAAYHPSLATLAALGVALAKDQKMFNERDRAVKEIAAKVDKNMKEILTSYQLTRDSDGHFILKRGSWIVYEEKTYVSGTEGGHYQSDYYSGLQDVGVDRNLFPTNDLYLLDRYKDSVATSPVVGHWQR